MISKEDFFENGDYKLITNLINDKMEKLKKYENFSKKYKRLYDVIDELELILDDKQKEKFNEVMQLVYETQEYYLALSYSLGVKYGDNLKNL